MHKSTDRGLTSQTQVIDTALATNLVDITFISADTGFAVGGYSSNGGTFVLGTSVILRTTDGGNSWSRVFSDNNIGGRVWKIQFLDSRNGFGSIEPYFSDTAAIVKTTDGGASWQVLGTGYSTQNNSYTGTQGTGFVTPLKGWLGGYYEGLFETSDGGASWQFLPFGANLNRFHVLDNKHVYAGGRTVYRWGDSTNFTVKVPAAPPAAPPHTLHPIAPNPAAGIVRISFYLHNETNVVLRILANDARRTLQLENKRLRAGHYEYEWDASSAASGNYAVWLGTDEIPLVQRFTVRH